MGRGRRIQNIGSINVEEAEKGVPGLTAAQLSGGGKSELSLLDAERANQQNYHGGKKLLKQIFLGYGKGKKKT